MVRFAFAPCGGLRFPKLVLSAAFGGSMGILICVKYVLEDDHSPMGGSDDTNIRANCIYLWGCSFVGR